MYRMGSRIFRDPKWTSLMYTILVVLLTYLALVSLPPTP